MTDDALKSWHWIGRDIAKKRDPVRVEAATYIEAKKRVARALGLVKTRFSGEEEFDFSKIEVRALYEYELRKKAVAA